MGCVQIRFKGSGGCFHPNDLFLKLRPVRRYRNLCEPFFNLGARTPCDRLARGWIGGKRQYHSIGNIRWGKHLSRFDLPWLVLVVLTIMSQSPIATE